jgi:hypothetical protein
MTNYVSVDVDLYIHKSDLIKLDKGEAVIGYKEIYNTNEYELVSKYAFLPSIQLNDNSYSVCSINK